MMIKLFNALSLREREKGEFQGILYPSGNVEIGIDVWRNLRKYDFASHKIYEFDNVAEAKSQFAFQKPKKTKILYTNT